MLSLENLVVVLADDRARQPAWEAALSWAAPSGARVHVFLPITTDTPRGLELAPGLEAMAEEGAEFDGERWLQSWLSDVPPGTTHTVTTTTRWVEAVLHETRRQEAGLLVLSAEAVAPKDLHQLLRQLPCPLYLARRGQPPRRLGAALTPLANDPLHKLLNDVVLEHMAKLAGWWQAEPVLVSAYPNPADLVPLMGDTYTIAEVSGEVAEGYERRLKAAAAAIGLGQAPVLAQLGLPDLVIPVLVKEGGIDCLLLGLVSRHTLASFWLGNTAEDLLQRIDCDALVLRPQDYYDPH